MVYVTHVSQVPESSIAQGGTPGGKRATVRWVISEEQGAPNFEMRLFHLDEGMNTEWHQHPWEHEVFVVAGRGSARSDAGDTPLEPGSVAFVPPGEMHQFRAAPGHPIEFICVVPRGTRACSVPAPDQPGH
ncbi:MAG: cupin domain-containing protein [Bacillota bacterium]|nr:cupin domain-containing protein [Bacillota bacterium]